MNDSPADCQSRGVTESQRDAPAFGGDVWLLDEPFSALDAETKTRVAENLRPMLAARTVVLVTHDASEAAALADFTAEP